MQINIEPLNDKRNLVAFSGEVTLNEAVRLYKLGGWLPTSHNVFTGLVWDFPNTVTEAQILEALESENVHQSNQAA